MGRFIILDSNFTGEGADLPFDAPDPLLLDLINNAAYQAYSLRKLTNDYTGPAVTVRRSSDSTTADIGFTSAGLLDTAALLAFAGSGDAFVTTWHDQSGNNRDLAQATAASQPQIVAAGALVTLGSTPGMSFGTDRHLRHSAPGFASLVAAGGATLCEVHVDKTNTVSYGETDQSSTGGRFIPWFWSSATPPVLNATVFDAAGTSQSNGASFTTAAVDEVHADLFVKPLGAGATRHRDGTQRATSTTWNPVLPNNTTVATLGGWANSTTPSVVSSDYSGKVGEHILFAGVLDAGEIATLDTSQSAYFGLA
ncbi:virion structural protein [Gordonia phage Lucky10]|uniref:Alpha-L-arabinofuranosidase n=1 Tax=Gordonia phage Lucky10 TaxID=1821557 RepID=A0A142KAY7_9CAUD|nr:virion structural protein [Gordonia phage Lucky10]AMS03270.1 alpha-L-arabinofuranosidase [Gordonia phage Lucky10]